MHSATMISVFRGGSRAGTLARLPFEHADLGGPIKLLYCRTNEKEGEKKKERESAGPLGLKRFFTSRWLELGSLY